ncbi:MAG: phage portal protein [Planctomycetota bacterium]
MLYAMKRKISKSESIPDNPRFRSISAGGDITISKENRALENDYDNKQFGKSQSNSIWQKYLENYSLHPWVHSSIAAIARNIAKCPFKLMQWKGDKGIEVKDHLLINLLEKPNPFYSGYDLKEGISINLSLAGNCFTAKEYNKRKPAPSDIPKELFILQSGKTVVVPGKTTPVIRYEYGKKPIEYQPFEMIHFKFWNPLSDSEGLSPLSPLVNTLITDYYAIAYNKNFFKKGGKVSGVFTTEKSLSDDSFERIKRQIETEYSGPDNFHKQLFLDNGLEYTPTTQSQKDSEFIEGRKQGCSEILGVIGTPPGILGILEYTNYSNMEEQKKTFVNELIMALSEKMAATLTVQLCYPIDENLYFEPDYKFIKAMAENEEKRTTMDVALVTNGIETINEVRARRGLPAVPWGYTWNRPFNLYPADEVKPEPAVTKSRLTKKEKKERIWRDYVDRTKPYEDEMIVVVRKFAKKQMAEVMDAIDKNYRPTRVGKDKIRKDAKVDNLMFNITLANKELQRQMSGVLSETMKEFGNVAIKRLGGSIDFDISDPRVVDYLNTKIFKFADEINKTTLRELGDTLGEGYNDGESIEEMKARVQDVFDGMTRAEPYRARTIARTEVISASNNASLIGYKTMGAEKKEWLTAIDERTRPEHAAVNGQVVNIEDDFSVGGEIMAYPGDPKGSAKNLCNCRCTLIPVVE